jgi:hypothetical protein
MRKTTKCLFIGTTKLFCAYKASISLEIGLSFRFVESVYNSSGDLSDHHETQDVSLISGFSFC